MRKIEKLLFTILLLLLILTIILLIIILNKYYSSINIHEIYTYIISKSETDFNPENLLSICISLNTGFGALILIFYGLVIPKSNLTLKAFIKYFIIINNYRFLALLSIPLTIILALFISNFDSYKGIQLSMKLLIPIPIISYLILFMALFEIENSSTLKKLIVKNICKIITAKGVTIAASAYNDITCQFSQQLKALILHDVIELLSTDDNNKYKEQMEFFDSIYGLVNNDEF